jgi:hypothetical protein
MFYLVFRRTLLAERANHPSACYLGLFCRKRTSAQSPLRVREIRLHPLSLALWSFFPIFALFIKSYRLAVSKSRFFSNHNHSFPKFKGNFAHSPPPAQEVGKEVEKRVRSSFFKEKYKPFSSRSTAQNGCFWLLQGSSGEMNSIQRRKHRHISPVEPSPDF